MFVVDQVLLLFHFLLLIRRSPIPTLFPYTTLFRSLPLIKERILVIILSFISGRRFSRNAEIGRAVQQECRDRARMPSSAGKQKNHGAHRMSENMDPAQHLVLGRLRDHYAGYGDARAPQPLSFGVRAEPPRRARDP